MKQDPFARASNVAGKAFNRVSSVLGSTGDPELITYKKLEPEDFRSLSDTYGADATLQYIRTMEAKMLTGGRYGRSNA